MLDEGKEKQLMQSGKKTFCSQITMKNRSQRRNAVTGKVFWVQTRIDCNLNKGVS